MSFHKVLLKLHLWIGLALSIFLLILGVTGSILVWQPEITRPKTLTVQPQAQTLPLSQLLNSVRTVVPTGRLEQVSFGKDSSEPYRFSIVEGGPRRGRNNSQKSVAVDPYTGQILAVQETGTPTKAVSTLRWIRQLHISLLAGQNGTMIVNYATLGGIFLIISGIILWWPRKIWAFKKGASWRRINFDLHSIAGLYTMVFFLVIAFTGSMIHWRQIGQWIVKTAHQTETVKPRAIRSVPPSPDAEPLPLDQLLAKANATLPGDRTTTIVMPNRPTDPVIMFRMRGGQELSQIFCQLDQYTAAILSADDPTSRPWAVQLTRSVVAIHEGIFFGMTGRVIACISSTAIPVMVITGFIIWWKRKLTEWDRKRRAAKGMPVQEQPDEDDPDLIADPSSAMQGS